MNASDILGTISQVAGVAAPFAVGSPQIAAALVLVKNGADIAQRLTAGDPTAEKDAAEWERTVKEWNAASDALDAAIAKHGVKGNP